VKNIRAVKSSKRDRINNYSISLTKNIFDKVFTLLVLLIIGPTLIFLAILIKWDSRGPILFRQTRIGKDGKPFTIYKFRTMHAETNPYATTPENDMRDPRVTRVGRLLRKAGLDEIPQLLNVLKGDMSIVGPRPEMPFLVSQYKPKQRKRLQVLPGITGLWQISPARYQPIHMNLKYDLYYIAHQSLSLDVMIIIMTVVHLFRTYYLMSSRAVSRAYSLFLKGDALEKGV
jgi:lipopolysaccharide/colanic/teichoic acid biosynthesis glycosyltransferase